jgi:hypothetical protein
MSLVEEAYFQAWGKVGGVGRLRRTFSLFANLRDMYELQVKREKPGLSDRELKRQIAKRMYISDDPAQGLLDRMEGRDVIEDDFPETVARVLAILSELGLKFHVTGGVVSAYYGDPRFTQDLDIVIQLIAGRPETKALLDRLALGYLVDEQLAMDAIRRNSIFQAIDEASMIKIDFHVGEKIPGELERSLHREILPGVVAPLASKEDAILSKLLWIQMGSGHKSRHDVKVMLKREEDLDRAVLRRRATTLGLNMLLAEIENEKSVEG